MIFRFTQPQSKSQGMQQLNYTYIRRSESRSNCLPYILKQGTRGNHLERAGTSWNELEPSRTSWNQLERAGTRWSYQRLTLERSRQSVAVVVVSCVHPSRHTTLFQRFQDVYATPLTLYRRLIDVKTMSCVYWDASERIFEANLQ